MNQETIRQALNKMIALSGQSHSYRPQPLGIGHSTSIGEPTEQEQQVQHPSSIVDPVLSAKP